MCGGWVGGETERKAQRKRHVDRKMRGEETHQVSMAVKVRVLCREEEGDETGEKGRQPEKA